MIEQRVTLRYGAQQIPAIVQAVQGDTGRDVIFELADYEIPAGATANYYIDKPDGNAVYNSAEVISSTEILAHMTEQALAEPGRNNGQVRILSDGEVITSFDFVLEVEAFRGILRLQSETEVNIFDQAIEDAVNTATEEAVAEIQAQTPVVTGMQNSIAPTYSASSTYAVGDYVMYNAQLYRCITAITTAEAWTAEHWIHVPIAPEVSDLKSAFNNLVDLDDIEWSPGHYIDSAGIIRDYEPYSITDYIPLRKNGVKFNISFTVYGNTATYVGFYDINKSPLEFHQIGSELSESTIDIQNVEYIRLTNENARIPVVRICDLRGTQITVAEELNDFEKAVFSDFGMIPFGNSFFFQTGMFYVSKQTASITSDSPLTVEANSSSAVKLVNGYLLSGNETNICVDIKEKSGLTAGATIIFYNSAGTYVSQSDATLTNGYAFKSIEIPENAKSWSLLFNFYANGTYRFDSINVYYGTDQILEKEFPDVIYKTYGTLGKKWSAVGDSLTANGTLGALSSNYVDYVADSVGLNAVNLGWGGSGYMADSGASKAFWQRCSTIPSDTDVLTVFGSLNDLDHAYDNVGTLNDNNTTTLYGCMNAFFTGAYSINAGMRVGIILPTPWQWMNRRYPGEVTTLKTEQYINALIEYAKWNSIPVLNLFDESGLRPWNEAFRNGYYKNADGTHPNSLGHYRFIYPKVKAFIQSLIAK